MNNAKILRTKVLVTCELITAKFNITDGLCDSSWLIDCLL